MIRFQPISFIFLAILLWTNSCADLKSGKVIAEDKMANILYDIALAESFVETYIIKDSLQNKDSILKAEIDIVFKFHHINPAQFSTSYGYYKQHPKSFQKLIDTANARAIRNRENSYSRRKVNPS